MSVSGLRLPRWRSALAAIVLLQCTMPASALEVACRVSKIWPARVLTISENVLVRPATRIVRRLPAIYRTITERVLVQPQRKIVVSQPAVFGRVLETVVVRPAMKVVRYIPPIRLDVRPNGAVLVESNKGRWVVVLRPALSVLDTWPGAYAKRTRTVLLRSMRAVVRAVPAVFGTRTRLVEVVPARYAAVQASAWYRTLTRQVLLDRPGVRLILSETRCSPGGIASSMSGLQLGRPRLLSTLAALAGRPHRGIASAGVCGRYRYGTRVLTIAESMRAAFMVRGRPTIYRTSAAGLPTARTVTVVTRTPRMLLRSMQAIVRWAPATYGTRKQVVVMFPQRYEVVATPATYRTITHRVPLDRPGLRLTFNLAECGKIGAALPIRRFSATR